MGLVSSNFRLGEKNRGMEFRNALDSAVSGVKTPVTNALQSSYSLGSAAVSNIDNAVRGANGVEKLKEYMPGPEGQEKIGRALSHPATKELLKLVVPPGGAQAYNIAAAVLKNQPSTTTTTAHSLHDKNGYEQILEQLKVLRDENDRMRADLERIKELKFSPNKLHSKI